MNLQDYQRWQDWDHNLSADHTESHKEFPRWICALGAIACAGLYAITLLVEFYEWCRQIDPSELFAMLWVAICAGLFLAGMLVAIFG